MSIEHRFVEVGGIQLHVAVTGPENGELLLLLHGFPEYWKGWSKQISFFAEQGYRVIVPDQRGYNLSDKPRRIADYSVDRLAQDAAELIDHFSSQVAPRERKAFVVGHDWGAAVAWQLALQSPERVKKLAILNVPHPRVMMRNLRSNPRQLLRSYYMFVFQLPRLPEVLLGAASARKLTRSLTGTSRPGTFTPAELADYREAWLRPGALSGMLNWYRAAFRAPPRRRLDPQVKPPTLILWGAKDRFLGRELAEQSTAYLERGKLEFVESATHWIQHEESERVNLRLASFFSLKSDI